MVMVCSPSVAMRASSLSARAGMMADSGWAAGLASSALRTEMRKPSVAAREISLPER